MLGLLIKFGQGFMQDKRRHQRIRFCSSPQVTIGYGGRTGNGTIENLSLSGLMLRTSMALEVGRRVGCEFSVFGSPVIDLAAIVASRVGDLFGVRFEAGPISQVLIDDAISAALNAGHASILTTHDMGSGKVMRIIGGLNRTLQNDVLYSLTKVGVAEMDLSEVTAVDQDGLKLCLLAQGRYGVRIGSQSGVFSKAWREVLQIPGGSEAGE